MVQGKVLVVHKGQSVAYKLQKDHPLFIGDMLVSGKRSRLNAKMHDKSVFSLSPYTKLVIDKSFYDPEKNERSSFLSLWFGRARFIVQKRLGKTDYKIKTLTSVCGLRDSDFALAVVPHEEKTSFIKKFLSLINPIRKAHAQVPKV